MTMPKQITKPIAQLTLVLFVPFVFKKEQL